MDTTKYKGRGKILVGRSSTLATSSPSWSSEPPSLVRRMPTTWRTTKGFYVDDIIRSFDELRAAFLSQEDVDHVKDKMAKMAQEGSSLGVLLHRMRL